MTNPGPPGNPSDPPPGYTQPEYPPPAHYPAGGPQPGYQEFVGKKVAAGVCGILIGGLGVHKFILGQSTAGIIMLLVTICTCGFGGIVMHAIGLVEGIMYLTKTDAEFYQLYAVQRKAWF